jgi:hypothetical protein
MQLDTAQYRTEKSKEALVKRPLVPASVGVFVFRICESYLIPTTSSSSLSARLPGFHLL